MKFFIEYRKKNSVWNLNLAKKAFRQVGLLVSIWAGLLLLGFVLFAVSSVLFVQTTIEVVHYMKGIREQQVKVARYEDDIRDIRRKIQKLDTKKFRTECAFLYEQIGARGFSWSELLDALEDVLPAQVRILSISPTVSHQKGIQLRLQVVAKQLNDFTTFLTKMYESGRFTNIVIQSEKLIPDTRELEYSLSVAYQPRVPLEEVE